MINHDGPKLRVYDSVGKREWSSGDTYTFVMIITRPLSFSSRGIQAANIRLATSTEKKSGRVIIITKVYA